ncbi:MAG: hypothetical protein FWC78_04850 [Defluviitaleaceae bacterium]|nr:hypothetical protein [Defluviitaleaceae bacterium]
MKNNLKDRYIYAVTRHLPVKMQKDVERELDGLITEMAEERQPNMASEDTIKEVLDELGSPEELALKYNGSGHNALISGVYFLMYKRVLRTALPIVATVAAILAAVGLFAGFDTDINIVLGGVTLAPITFVSRFIHVFASSISITIQAFAAITVIFAILDYSKAKLKDGDITDLPNVPEAEAVVSITGGIAEIALTIAMVTTLLFFPQYIGGGFDGRWIPAFDAEYLRSLWLPILAWGAISVVSILYQIIIGHYNIKVVVTTLAANIALAVLTVVILGSNNLIHQDFTAYLSDILGGLYIVTNILSHPNRMLMAIILVALAIDTVDVLYKALKR